MITLCYTSYTVLDPTEEGRKTVSDGIRDGLWDVVSTTIPLVQRKIYHVLQSEGEGATFRYLPVLRAPFDLTQPILVTEKVDGSTMQSALGEPWKRFDRFSKGDPRKREVPEEERYELRRCTPDDPSVKWYLASFEAYREQFEEFGRRMPDGWIYFEALGGKISPRYGKLEPTVRVFDVSIGTGFKPLADAAWFAVEMGLPVVAHRVETFETLERLLAVLAEDVSQDLDLPSHQLEGWVLRQQLDPSEPEVVAKIRVGDPKKLVR